MMAARLSVVAASCVRTHSARLAAATSPRSARSPADRRRLFQDSVLIRRVAIQQIPSYAFPFTAPWNGKLKGYSFEHRIRCHADVPNERMLSLSKIVKQKICQMRQNKINRQSPHGRILAERVSFHESSELHNSFQRDPKTNDWIIAKNRAATTSSDSSDFSRGASC